MPSFEDKEFGKVVVRRSARTRNMKASIAPTGELRISLPSYVPIFIAKRMVTSSRQDIRKLFESIPKLEIKDGMTIGKSHSLHIRTGPNYSLKRSGQQLILTITSKDYLLDSSVTENVRSAMIAILRKEAKAHLPRRIEYLAKSNGFSYASVRFTHASSRWGSCNQYKAISLNIALMNLPFELIDYVLVHELAHTIHMNHSKEFWDAVAIVDVEYKSHRRKLKDYSPHI